MVTWRSLLWEFLTAVNFPSNCRWWTVKLDFHICTSVGNTSANLYYWLTHFFCYRCWCFWELSGQVLCRPTFFFLKQISFECWRLLGLLGVTESLVFTMECGALYAATVLSITDSEGTRELRWSTLYRLFSTQSLIAPSWILTRVLRFPTPEGWEHRKWKSNCNRARLRRFSLQDAVFFFFYFAVGWTSFFLVVPWRCVRCGRKRDALDVGPRVWDAMKK